MKRHNNWLAKQSEQWKYTDLCVAQMLPVGKPAEHTK
jgi:hypothetical protein